MKKIPVFILALLIVLTADAQESIPPIVKKFEHYYTSNQPDSIYNLFNAMMKEAVKPDGTRMLISQLKSQMGGIVNAREVAAPGAGISEFRISFEKPLVDLALIIQNDSISGIWQRQVDVVVADSVSKASADNYSVNNEHGTLYGTLVLPATTGQVPVVLMIAGSGPTDRNMNQGQSLKTNAFLMLAEALAEQGIASVRYDKRGVGKSIGASGETEVLFDDFVEDAELFIEKLQKDSRFSEVIVLGHSEGSIIGSLVSEASDPKAFVSLCGPASGLLELVRVQLKTSVNADLQSIADNVLDSLAIGMMVNQELPSPLDQLFHSSIQPYLISSNKYKPSEVLSKLKLPILIIGGDTDLQVNTGETKLLARAAKSAEVYIVPGMNHVLKSAPLERMQNLQTYTSANLPLHPELVSRLVNFIKNVI